MPNGKSNKAVFWAALVLMLVVTLAAGVFFGLNRKPAAVQSPRADDTQLHADAATSWKVFVDDARAKCEKADPKCTVDYTALRDAGGHSFGVTVIGWKDSDYIIDVYRFDPATRKWEPAPTIESDGAVQVDTTETSRRWAVPEGILKDWIDAANSAVKHKYARGN